MKSCCYSILFLIFLFSPSVYSQVNFTSSNLPIIVINTNGQEIVDEPKILVDMGIIYNGEGVRNYVTDDFNEYNGKIGIEYRGSSSQQFPKKSFAIETRDADGEDLDVSIFGMPEEEDWVLYAPYSDKSLIRNTLIYKLSNEIGRYTTRTRFVEVVLNGEYWGVYVFMEKIKRDKNRVNVKKCEPKDSNGVDLTGGYIFKLDKQDGAATQGWYSQFVPYPGSWQRVYYQYHYPKEEDITEQQKEYIYDFVYNFESTMYLNIYNDPFKGFYEIIDVDTFVDYFLLNELPHNVDAYRLSTYLYKNRNDIDPRLKMGPIWDFNLAFGNCDFYEGWRSDSLQLDIFLPLEDMFPKPFWWKKLLNDEVVKNKSAERWNELSKGSFSKERVNSIIDSLVSLVDEARVRNFQKWDIIGEYVWPNYFVANSYEEEIDYLKSWIETRWNWLDNYFTDDFSSVDWIDPSENEINLELNEQKDLSINDFYLDYVNVDSMGVITENSDLIIEQENDSLTLYSTTTGSYKIKIEGYYENQIKVLSPSYLVTVGTTNIEIEDQPNKFNLYQNYPNPFNPATTIKFTILHSQFATLKVYNVLGREVKTLINKQLQPGEYKVEFDGSNLPSGVYFYRLNAGEFLQIRKMMLIK